MNKLYIVTGSVAWEGEDVLGVFSSQEKAEEFIKLCEDGKVMNKYGDESVSVSYNNGYFIYEKELDCIKLNKEI